MTFIIIIVSVILLFLLIVFSIEYSFYKDCLNEEDLCVSIKYEILKNKIMNIINKTGINKIENLEYDKINIDNIMFLSDCQINFYIKYNWISVKISYWDYILYYILLKKLVRNLRKTKINKSNERYKSFFNDTNDIKQNDFEKDTNIDEVTPIGFKVEKNINN